MSKIRIAVIGCGGIARHAHFPSYQNLKDRFEIVACCDILSERARKTATQYGIPEYYTDYHDLLNRKDLDAVDICTPNYLHSTIAVDALNAGLNVLCEKPDAINPEEAKKMGDAAIKNDRLLMVIRNNRFIPEVQFLKRYIEEGNFGKIYAGRCGWQRRRGIPGKGGWFTTKEKSGGGPLIDLGVHMIDLAVWLMGNPKPVSVTGCTYSEFSETNISDSDNSKFGDRVTDGIFDVEDLAMGFIRFDNGACLQIEFSWASNVEKENKFMELRGNKAGCNFTFLPDPVLKIFREDCERITDLTPAFDGKEVFGHEGNIRNFADALEGKAEPVFKPAQGLDMIRILDAIYSSANSGKEVQL